MRGGGTSPADEVAGRLWTAMRGIAPTLPHTPTAEWVAALESVLATRPPASPATSAWWLSARTTGSPQGWLVAALYRAFRRSAHARAIGLVDDPLENLVLVPAGLVPAANGILQPLRDAHLAGGDPGAGDGADAPTPWRVVTTM